MGWSFIIPHRHRAAVRTFLLAAPLALPALAMSDGLPASQPAAAETQVTTTQPGDTQPSAEPDRRIASLIEQMGDQDPNVRDDAQESLLDLGEPARKQLQDAAHSGPPEVRKRAAYTLKRLGLSPRPTRITLHLKDAPASEVLDAIAHESGRPITVSRPAARAILADAKLTIEADRLPYWILLRKVCTALKMKPACYPGENGSLLLQAGEGSWSPELTSVDGLFAVHAGRIESNGQLTFGDPNPTKLRSVLVLEAFAEPRAHCLWCEHAEVIRGEDARGQPVGVGPAQVMSDMASGFETIYVPLNVASAEHVVSVEGSADFAVGADFRHIDIDNLGGATGVEQPAGDWKVCIRDLHQSAQSRWSLRIAVIPKEVSDTLLFDLRKGLISSPPTLFDASGKQIFKFGAATVTVTANGLELLVPYINSTSGTKPTRLVWDLATKFGKMKMHFRFTDLPLP